MNDKSYAAVATVFVVLITLTFGACSGAGAGGGGNSAAGGPNRYLIVTSADGAYVSDDGGSSFTNYPSYTHTEAAVDAEGNLYLGGVTAGALITNLQFSSVRTLTAPGELPSTAVIDVAVEGDSVYWCTEHGVAVQSISTDVFVTRTTADGLGDNRCNAIDVDGSLVVAATDGGVSISEDGGVSFINRTTANGLADNLTTVVWADSSEIIVGVFDNGFARSENKGEGFAAISGLESVSPRSAGRVDNVIGLGTATGIYVSTTGGAAYSQRQTFQGLPNNVVTDVHVVDAQRMYVATLSGLAFSEDAGANFTTVSGVTTGNVYEVVEAVR